MTETTPGDVDELKAASAQELHRAVREEGQEELDRPASSLFWSGLAAGLTISASLLAEGTLEAHLPDSPARPLLAALGYPMGFLLVILGRMQLFTESTITAMLPLVTAPSRWALLSTLRLWGIVIGANLVGTSLAAAAIVWGWPGDPAIRAGMIHVSHAVIAFGPFSTLLNAIPAGFLIAIIAWALPNAREQSFFVIFAVTYLVAIGGFSHSIVGSNEAFVLIFSGEAGAGRVLFGFLVPAILGNLVGGAGLFAVLAHAQVKDEMRTGPDLRKKGAARRSARPQPAARKPLS
ncbi:formate/nitrite transporter family protein [Sphingomonas sp. 28-63-12]|uniref:formate/nitrite transporter family protein n=1 Tax=Sphingomonas sp. 28-63-12 TaxID=1970434 RepID=UPI000BD35C53|nr:MAG: formate transporter [Sphingomonas sp. 28-63-12]